MRVGRNGSQSDAAPGALSNRGSLDVGWSRRQLVVGLTNRFIHHAFCVRIDDLEAAERTDAARHGNATGDTSPVGRLMKRQIDRDLRHLAVLAEWTAVPQACVGHAHPPLCRPSTG
jgi:hypothetical protein